MASEKNSFAGDLLCVVVVAMMEPMTETPVAMPQKPQNDRCCQHLCAKVISKPFPDCPKQITNKTLRHRIQQTDVGWVKNDPTVP